MPEGFVKTPIVKHDLPLTKQEADVTGFSMKKREVGAFHRSAQHQKIGSSTSHDSARIARQSEYAPGRIRDHAEELFGSK